MIRILLAVFLSLNFVACGSGGSDSEEGKSQEKQKPQEAVKQSPSLVDGNQSTPKPEIANKNVSLSACISAHLQAQNTSKAQLKKLSCEKITDSSFALLSDLTSLTSLRITDTNLSANEVESIATHINQAQMLSLILERDNLNKARVDKLDPNFSYSNKHYKNLTHLSLKDNIVEGLLVVDYFPALVSLDLRGNIFPSNRLHHINAIDNLKTFYVGDNPHIQNFNDMQGAPKAEASIETMDISNLAALDDISELLEFQSLHTLTIDNTQLSQFTQTLLDLRAKGVQIKTP